METPNDKEEPSMKLCLILALTLLSSALQGANVGERLSPVTLADQFDEPAQLDAQTRLLLVASSRGAAEVVDQALADKPKGYLEERNALYVVDVSQMPSMVTNWVLKPSMKSADYRILLDYESEVAPEHLGQGDQVLWLELDDMAVQARQTFSSAENLQQALEQQ